MNKTFKLLALLTALALCLSFAACGGKEKADNTTAAETTTAADVIETVQPEETAEPVDASEASTEELTAESADTTASATTVADTTASATTAASGVAQPSGTAAIVALFNDSANAVRKDKPGYSCNTTNYVNNIDCKGNKSLQRIADTALKFIDAAPTSETVKKGAGHNGFGASSASYASALNASFVKSATCTKSGNNYKIKINLKNETLKDLPADASKTSTGKAMLVLGAKDVYEQTDKIPGVNITKFAPTYTGCYIDATINATTGKLTSCTYFWHSVNDVEAKIIGMTAGAIVDFGIQRAYTLNY